LKQIQIFGYYKNSFILIKLVEIRNYFRVWDQPIEGIDCGKEAEKWFSEYLQKPEIKLIQHLPELSMRKSGHQVNNELKKSDQFPVSSIMKRYIQNNKEKFEPRLHTKMKLEYI